MGLAVMGLFQFDFFSIDIIRKYNKKSKQTEFLWSISRGVARNYHMGGLIITYKYICRKIESNNLYKIRHKSKHKYGRNLEETNLKC